MLLELRVRNYRSIRDEIVVSFVASNEKKLADTNLASTGIKSIPHVLRSAVVYGPNASGKSTLLLALHYMRYVVADSATVLQPGQTFNVQPFRLDVEYAKQPTEFEITFLLGGVRHQYGFSFTPEGRGFIAQQMARVKAVDPDTMASFIVYGEEGPAITTAAAGRDLKLVSANGESMIRRKGDWFICISAYHCPVYEKRWIQDRQNFVSVFHDGVGLIVGGGNTKLQPLWSNFTVGDISLLHHTPGDISPKFTPPPGIVHIPSAAALEKADPPGLLLAYDGERCEIVAEPVNDTTLNIRLKATTKSGMPVAAHITLIPHTGHAFTSERGTQRVLNDEPFNLTSKDLGGWIEHAGWRLSLPEGSTVTWPVMPHNPYAKDGASKPAAGRIVVTIPFSETNQEYMLTLTVK